MSIDTSDLRMHTYGCGGIDVRPADDHPERCPYCYGPHDNPDLEYDVMRLYDDVRVPIATASTDRSSTVSSNR